VSDTVSTPMNASYRTGVEDRLKSGGPQSMGSNVLLLIQSSRAKSVVNRSHRLLRLLRSVHLAPSAAMTDPAGGREAVTNGKNVDA
jgi:hypothetical protein